MVGAFGFALLAGGVGKACARRGGKRTVYWVGMEDLSKVDSDELTQQAIAAAAFDAISRLDDADSIVLTRVVAEGKVDEVCATVSGRGIRLIKADSDDSSARPDAH